MNQDRESTIKFVVLSIIDRKGTVSSSYFFNQLFQMLGLFESVEQLLRQYKNENLITDEGYFDAHSGLIKNIKISPVGNDFLSKNRGNYPVALLKQQIGDHDLLNKLFAS